MASPREIPVTVLTGFLGSGKTTLLNRLLRHPGMAKAIVIVNEFGEIALDHDLIESVDEETVLLQSGCMCCMVRNDLVETLREIHAKRRRGEIGAFERVLIETTGLADPAPILQTLMTDASLTPFYRLNGVIATIDAVLGAETLDRHIEAGRQAAVAERMILTKSDLTDKAQVDALRQRLHALNPAAPIDAAVHGRVDPTDFFEFGPYDAQTKSLDVGKWLNDAAYETAPQPQRDHSVEGRRERISSVCVTLDRPVDGEALDLWLQTLLRLKGPDLLRFKAIVDVAQLSGPLVLQAVQHVIHPPTMLPSWPSEDRRSRFVFIGHGLAELAIRDSLRRLVEQNSTAH